MPLDLDALTALRDLTAPRPELRRSLPALPALVALVETARVDVPRRRVVGLALLAAVAGLVCGLIAPVGPALAAPLTAPLTAALSGALTPTLPDRPDPRPVLGQSGLAVDDAATPDPFPAAPAAGRPGVSAVDAVAGALRSGLAAP